MRTHTNLTTPIFPLILMISKSKIHVYIKFPNKPLAYPI